MTPMWGKRYLYYNYFDSTPGLLAQWSVVVEQQPGSPKLRQKQAHKKGNQF